MIKQINWDKEGADKFRCVPALYELCDERRHFGSRILCRFLIGKRDLQATDLIISGLTANLASSNSVVVMMEIWVFQPNAFHYRAQSHKRRFTSIVAWLQLVLALWSCPTSNSSPFAKHEDRRELGFIWVERSQQNWAQPHRSLLGTSLGKLFQAVRNYGLISEHQTHCWNWEKNPDDYN